MKSTSAAALIFSMVGCSSGILEAEVSVESTDVPTVFRAIWEVEEADEVWFEFGSPDCDVSTPASSDLSGETLLLGLPPLSKVCYRLVATLDGERLEGEEMRLDTEKVDAQVPYFQVDDYNPDSVEPGFILGSTALGPAARFVLNREGEAVWSSMAEDGILSPQTMASPDGEGILVNEFSDDFENDVGVVKKLGYDGTEIWSQRTVLSHHAFELLPDGTIVYLAIDVRNVDPWGAVVGDAIFEISPEGVSREVWNIWDHTDVLPLEHNSAWELGFYPQGKDYSHANAIRYDEAHDSYTISFRNLDTILEIDRETGEHLRQFGRYGDYSLTDGQYVGRPHAAYWTSDDTLLFFTSPRTDNESWAVEIRVDDNSKTAEQIWSYGRGEGHVVLIMGEATRLPGGNTLVNFGSKGLLTEVTPEGEIAWRVHMSVGNFPGHTKLLTDFYSGH